MKHLVSNFAHPNALIQGYEHIIPTVKSRVLLPNLASLTVVGSKEGNQPIIYFEFLEQLIPTSLRALKISNVVGLIPTTFFSLIRKAITGCPRLDLLWITSPLDFVLHLIINPPPVLHIKNFAVHTSDVYTEILEWVAAMPQLKTLRIGDQRSSVSWFWRSEVFSAGAFTSLRSLTITLADIRNATRLWSTPLVKSLTFVRLLFLGYRSFEIRNAFGLFESIANHSPNLASLSLVFMKSSWERPVRSLPVKLLSLLSPLSLDFLEINGADFDTPAPHVFGQIGQLWPSLRTLNLRNNYVTLADLAVISRSLPRLSHLSLMLVPEYPTSRTVDVVPVQHFGQPLTLQTSLLFIYGLSASEQDEFAL